MSYKYGIKNIKKKCTEVFVSNRETVLQLNPDLGEVVSNIPSMVLEVLGIELEN
jgi:hypothetical protein